MFKLRNIFKSQKGSTLVGSLFIIVSLTFFASSAIYVTNEENSATVNEMQTTQALQVGSAGLEYASKQLDLGLDPSVSNQEFGYGNFTITTDPTLGTVTVTSEVGDAKKIQSITTDNFSDNCVSFDSSLTPYTDGKEIYDVALVKTCNEAAYITSIEFEWDWDNDDDEAEVTFIGIEGTTVYNPGIVGSPSGGANSGQTIDVEDYALTSNGTYEFTGPPHGIRFDEDHPGDETYTITITFADGSQISNTFTDGVASEENVGFAENDGVVTVDEDKCVTVEVIGSAMTYGEDGASIPVDLELGTMDDEDNITYQELFDGDAVSAGDTYQETTEGETQYVLKAHAEYDSFSAEYECTDSNNTLLLVDGESFGEEDVEDFLDDYMDDEGNVTLEDNQVIAFFELGTTNTDSSAYNLQDVVVLYTIEDSSACSTDSSNSDDNESEGSEESEDNEDDDEDSDDEEDDSDGHSNNGHGNNCDGVDSSNPGNGNGGPNGEEDASGDEDDECGNGNDDEESEESEDDNNNGNSNNYHYRGSWNSSSKNL